MIRRREFLNGMAVAFLVVILNASGFASAQDKSGNLDIYWIDTEGGAATLVVTPSGESMLIDTGYPDDDRDAKRIVAAAREAGISRIDHLVISHYHRDHVGGLAALTKLIPVGRYYGPNDKLELVNREWYDSYTKASGGKRTIVKAGDTLPLKGVDVLVVTADERVLAKPVNGGSNNPLCASTPDMSPAGFENSRMVGMLLTFGNFRFLNLVDLDWRTELELACPVNKVGRVTLYQTGRHGSLDGAGSPALLGAIRPQIVVANNGPKKGLGQTDKRVQPIVDMSKSAPAYERNSYRRLAALPGLEGIWQVHRSLLDSDPAHNTSEDMIANLEDTADCKGSWIKASVARDGRFTITNGRTGFSKSYMARSER